ncbi:MAG: rhodanese-like domain-containing protein [Rubrivivax sp.]
MKFLIDNWMLILMAVTSGGLLLWPNLGKGGGGGISTAAAVQLINRSKGVLIDVCEPDEFAASHAGGARNVPLGQLPEAKGLPTNKTLPLVLLCATGARAARAAGILRKAGYEGAVAVTGGNRAWREANLPMEKGEKAEKADKAEKAEKTEKGA